jgi:hypothetical protein
LDVPKQGERGPEFLSSTAILKRAAPLFKGNTEGREISLQRQH